MNEREREKERERGLNEGTSEREVSETRGGQTRNEGRVKGEGNNDRQKAVSITTTLHYL